MLATRFAALVVLVCACAASRAEEPKTPAPAPAPAPTPAPAAAPAPAAPAVAAEPAPVAAPIAPPPVPSTKELDAPHAVKDGALSIATPKNWELKEVEGLLQIAVGPIDDNFATNVALAKDAFPGNLKEYAASNIAYCEKTAKEFKKVSDAEVKLDAGDAIRLVTTSEQEGKHFRQVFYLLKHPAGGQLTLTCTTLAEKNDAFDVLFESIAKSLKFDK